MKILINTLPIKVGGGLVKLEALLIYLDTLINEYDFLVVTSKQDFFNRGKYIRLKFKGLNSDLYSFSEYFKATKELSDIEKDFKPDFVFTLFGPSLWRPKGLHLTGFAIPHYVYPESPYFHRQNLKKKFMHFLRSKTKMILFRRNSDYYWTESDDVSERLAKLLRIKQSKVLTVSPRNHQLFDHFKLEKSYELKESFTLLTISAYYPHKNFEIFPLVIKEIRKLNSKFNIRFLTTLKEKDFKQLTQDEVYPEWLNLGPMKIQDCIELYQNADAMFLPTLLESFSASYTEAMQTGTPIITSDLPFAHYCCQDAAFYIDPQNAISIAHSIIELMEDSTMRYELVKNGKRRLGELTSGARPEERYLDIMQNIFLMQ